MILVLRGGATEIFFAAHLSRATFVALRGRPFFHSITIFSQQCKQRNSLKRFLDKGLKNILSIKKFRKILMNKDFRPSENWEIFSKNPQYFQISLKWFLDLES